MDQKQHSVFQILDDATPLFWLMFCGYASLALCGLAAGYYMEHHGHYVTGMNNHVVWGLPHIFAVWLIVSASGVLNVASLSSVFGKTQYQPMARLSSVLAIALLIGGLGIVLLDLGRPDRLIIAMTHYNFKSVFAWNILLYTGFLVVVGLYLMTMLTPSWGESVKRAGSFVFVWRLILTGATGLIFGLLLARDAYIALLMVPMFISASLALGTALYILVLITLCYVSGRTLDDSALTRLSALNAKLVVAALLIALVHHLANLFISEHQTVARTILFNGGAFTWLFWLGQVILGSVVPFWLYKRQPLVPRNSAFLASKLVALGGFAMMIVIILVPQVLPLNVLPGYQVSSSFNDGVRTQYWPKWPEWLLGIGGLGFAMAATLLATRVLPLLPRHIK